MAKLNFQQALLQSSVSEIIVICWFDAQETFLLLLLMLKTVVLLNMFVETVILFWILTENSKEQHLFEIEIFNVMNVFTITFDKFNTCWKIYQYANAKLKLWSGVSCAERYFCDVWELFPDWSFMRFHDILEEAARQLIRTKLNLIPLTTPGLIYKVCAIVSGQVFNYFCFVCPT